MGYNDPCPYVEIDKNCPKCVTCHAITPPVMDKARRRTCTRTRQWPGCLRYQEAWKQGVKPYREGYAVKPEEATPTPTGGIGAVSFSSGLPTQPRTEPEIPCEHLVYQEGGCSTCGGYVCFAVDKRVMSNMLDDTCMEKPGECQIYINYRDKK